VRWYQDNPGEAVPGQPGEAVPEPSEILTQYTTFTQVTHKHSQPSLQGLILRRTQEKQLKET